MDNWIFVSVFLGSLLGSMVGSYLGTMAYHLRRDQLLGRSNPWNQSKRQ